MWDLRTVSSVLIVAVLVYAILVWGKPVDKVGASRGKKSPRHAQGMSRHRPNQRPVSSLNHLRLRPGDYIKVCLNASSVSGLVRLSLKGLLSQVVSGPHAGRRGYIHEVKSMMYVTVRPLTGHDCFITDLDSLEKISPAVNSPLSTLHLGRHKTMG
jgi:hypothetical protein